jgi:ABC-type transporter Mla subunit MlaD
MNERGKGLEFKVGLFVFVGLAVLAILVVQFGRVGEGFQTYYDLTVRFPDASGLLKSSDVLDVWREDRPRLGRYPARAGRARRGRAAADLRAREGPVGSKFTIGSSGLLGDRYVAVSVPPGQTDRLPARQCGDRRNTRTGMDDLTREGGFLVKDLRDTVQNINGTFTRP